MYTFFLLILIGVGITNLVVNAGLLEGFRNLISKRSSFFGELINCMLCSGFWVGFILGCYENVFPIYLGAAVSLFSFMLSRILDYVDLLIAIKATELEGENDERE